MEENNEYENNIVYDAYYLISLFNKDNKKVTQLQVQKIMYFFEAYYMCINNTEQLYDCNFKAWALGPVSIPLYNELKKFGDKDIILSDEQIDIAQSICEDKKKIIEYIYEVFGKVSAMTLVELTHRTDSPWYEKWIENGEKVAYGKQSDIDKVRTRDWFREIFLNG